jgi:hypothetical protein
MGKTAEQPAAPTCPYCGQLAHLVTGEVVYPHRPDLGHRYFWLCAPCEAWVGTHRGTQRALGQPAKKELRRARNALHEQVIDPIWKGAPDCGKYTFAPGDGKARKKILKVARPRVYRFLGHKLGLSDDEVHAGMFTIEQCRAARVALANVTYLEGRDWCKQNPGPKKLGKGPPTGAPIEEL